MSGDYGMLWLRDGEKESFMETLEKGWKYFVEKYKAVPEEIFCSIKDIDIPIIFNDVVVTPQKNRVGKGNIWYKNSTIGKVTDELTKF